MAHSPRIWCAPFARADYDANRPINAVSVWGGFLYSSFMANSATPRSPQSPKGVGLPASRSRNRNLCDGAHTLRAESRIVCRYRIWEMTMRLIRFAIGMSLVAVSVLGSARAQSPAELSQVSGQEALTNRFEAPVSEMDRLSDRQQLNAYFFARSHDRLR
jgi:hypothetical protein